MLDIEKWRKRLLRAWKKKMKAHRGKRPKETTTRWQDGVQVTLFLWDDKHAWWVTPMRRNGRPALMKRVLVEVDEPISQAAINAWLEKTEPIE